MSSAPCSLNSESPNDPPGSAGTGEEYSLLGSGGEPPFGEQQVECQRLRVGSRVSALVSLASVSGAGSCWTYLVLF
jgi:hypothetical protein